MDNKRLPNNGNGGRKGGRRKAAELSTATEKKNILTSDVKGCIQYPPISRSVSTRKTFLYFFLLQFVCWRCSWIFFHIVQVMQTTTMNNKNMKRTNIMKLNFIHCLLVSVFLFFLSHFFFFFFRLFYYYSILPLHSIVVHFVISVRVCTVPVCVLYFINITMLYILHEIFFVLLFLCLWLFLFFFFACLFARQKMK